MNFNDIDDQITLNETRLKDEMERYNEIRSRIGYISIVYTLFAAFSYQLISYSIDLEFLGLIYKLSLWIFLLSFCISIVFSIRLLIPVEIAHKDLPEAFYKNYKEEYLQDGIVEDEIDVYLKHTYRDQLEKAVKHNFELNNRKSKFHYNSFLAALVALIPYVICIGLYVSNKTEDTTKVELTNEIFSDMSKKKVDSGDSSSAENKASNPPPQKVDTSKVIIAPPVYIKENKDSTIEKR